jgi:hypothetical protein
MIQKIFNRNLTYFNNLSLRKENEKDEFLNWFVGFIKAESHFGIRCYRKMQPCFIFIIGLHLDNLNVFKYIQKIKWVKSFSW